ncbi:MAG: HIT family protein [Gammaproteobacteria bacterium]|nr:HIT family protein [Gammaproteobacteria bacterium]
MNEQSVVQKIVSRELDAVIVYESDEVIAFADHDPINFGHILIAPKAHYRTLLDLPDHLLLEIHDVARDLYRRLEIRFKPDGIGLMQNNGSYPEFEEPPNKSLRVSRENLSVLS